MATETKVILPGSKKEKGARDDLAARLERAAARSWIQGEHLVLRVPTRQHAEYIEGMAKDLDLEAKKWKVKGWKIEIVPES